MIAGSNTGRNAGEYVSIGVIPGTTATNDIVVAVWYDQTERVLKYAYRTVAPAGDTVHENRWDFMVIPALGTGHYALKENKVSIESSNNWSSTTASVLQNQLDTTQPKTATPATVDSVLAYKTSKAYETAYLKKE